MDSWSILEISPTNELSLIKKAYAKKLRVHHPEDDPNGFQRLREAYEYALSYAKNYYEDEKEDYDNLPEDDNHRLKISDLNNMEELFSTNEAQKKEEPVDEFMCKVEKLYHNFFDCIELENWEELLNDEIMWRLDCKDLIHTRITNFLIDNHNVPKNVWLLLNTHFHWDEQEEYLNEIYSVEVADYFLRQISDCIVPGYNYFNKDIQIDYESYLKNRDNAFCAFLSNNLKEALQYISLAYEIYDRDPYLLCMSGECYFKMGNSKKALDEFKKANEINSKDSEIYFYQAQIAFECKEFLNCLNICNHILTNFRNESNNLRAGIFEGKCLHMLGNTYHAGKYFIDMLGLHPSNQVIINQLNIIYRELIELIEKNPYKFRARKELKRIQHALGKTENIESIKITPRHIFHSVKEIVVFLFLLSVILLIIIGTHGGAALIIIVRAVWGHYTKNKK